MRKAILATALLGLSSTAAFAADNGIYFGGSLGNANVDIEQAGVRLDGDDTGFKLIAGLRPLDWFGIEANYVNFGEPDQGILAADVDGISAFGVFFAPVGPVDLFAKGGIISFDSSIKVDGIGDIRQDDGVDLAYGVGAQFRFLSLAVRAEYEIFDIDDAKDVNMLSLGVTYTFL
jgi:opacity protein-like surface antigen